MSGEAIAAVVEVAIDIGKALFELFGQLNDKQHDAESMWTMMATTQAAAKAPNKNVIVCHVPYDIENAVGMEKMHYELPLPGPFNMTQGYDIILLDSGKFTRNGDGGAINWGLNGNFKRDPENVVVFSPVSRGTATPASTKLRQLNDQSKASESADGVTHASIAPKEDDTAGTDVAALPTGPPMMMNPGRLFPNGYFFVYSDSGLSAIAYYANMKDNGGNTGEQPTKMVMVTQGPRTSGGNIQFEARNGVRFDDGEQFHWAIHGFGGDMPNKNIAGMADNGRVVYNVFRDNDRLLFCKDGHNWYTSYWCY